MRASQRQHRRHGRGGSGISVSLLVAALLAMVLIVPPAHSGVGRGGPKAAADALFGPGITDDVADILETELPTSGFDNLSDAFRVTQIAGIGFAIASILKFKAHKDNPTVVTWPPSGWTGDGAPEGSVGGELSIVVPCESSTGDDLPPPAVLRAQVLDASALAADQINEAIQDRLEDLGDCVSGSDADVLACIEAMNGAVTFSDTSTNGLVVETTLTFKAHAARGKNAPEDRDWRFDIRADSTVYVPR